MCVQQFIKKCVVLRESQTESCALRIPVGLKYSRVVTRGHVSYKKYLTYTSTILLTTLRVSWSKQIGAVFIGNVRFLVYDILYIYMLSKYNILYKIMFCFFDNRVMQLSTENNKSDEWENICKAVIFNRIFHYSLIDCTRYFFNWMDFLVSTTIKLSPSYTCFTEGMSSIQCLLLYEMHVQIACSFASQFVYTREILGFKGSCFKYQTIKE